MKRLLVIAVITASILLSAGLLNADRMVNPYYDILPRSSASYSPLMYDNLINPVFPAIDDTFRFHHRSIYQADRKEYNQYLGANLGGFSVSGFWLNSLYNPFLKEYNPNSSFLLTISQGYFFRNIFGFGVGYSRSYSEADSLDTYRSWRIGFLFRPIQYLSFGYVLKDLGSAKLFDQDLGWQQVYSIGVRPYRDYVTMTCDVTQGKDENLFDSDVNFMLTGKLPKDITLFASMNLKKEISFGVQIPIGGGLPTLGSLVVDYSASNFMGDNLSTHSVGFTLQGARHPNQLINGELLLVINLSGDYPEVSERSLFSKAKPNFMSLLMAISHAAQDPTVKEIILVIDDPKISFSQAEEIRTEIKRFKESGKKVHAVLNTVGNKEYYIAVAANKIYMSPNNTFELEGLSAQVYFFKDGMQKFGIKYESVRAGKYKSFNEPFTRSGMSDEYRENMISLLTSLNETYISAIVQDRKIQRETIDRLLNEQGVISPKDAVKLGFVDEVIYDSDLRSRLINKPAMERLYWVNLTQYLSQDIVSDYWGTPPKIAVIVVDGSIVHAAANDRDDEGNNSGRGIFGRNISDSEYTNMLREAFEDDFVKAVVIRVNSGGGAALAADNMWHELARLKKKYNKPVVFSFGSMAASGGYYLACTGDPIFVNASTITGSIGVIFGKISVKELYAKLGINKEVIKTSEFADIFSESRELTDKEMQILQTGIDFTYQRFLQRVKDARGYNDEKAELLAGGRVYSGVQAVDNKLANQYGGILAAISQAAQLAKLKEGYSLKVLPGDEDPFMQMLEETMYYKTVTPELRTTLDSLKTLKLLDGKELYMYPYFLEIK